MVKRDERKTVKCGWFQTLGGEIGRYSWTPEGSLDLETKPAPSPEDDGEPPTKRWVRGQK